MNKRVLILILAVIGIVSSIIYLQSQKVSVLQGSNQVSTITPMTNDDKAKLYPVAKDITTPDGFINTDGINISDLIGKKVILVDFWTYSCINCQRTTPYLNAWYDKYKDQGLEIIGIHTPEFEFEKDYANVQLAVTKEAIKFPVVLDNDFSTWQAYGNRYWPRKYLIDIDGYIVYDHIGEGAYEETEQKIQAVLSERARRLDQSIIIDGTISQPEGTEVVDSDKVGSQEVYFGSGRNSQLVNGQTGSANTQILTIPSDVKGNGLYLGGIWKFTEESAESQGQAAISYRYQAKHVYFVASADILIEAEVLLDGQPLGSRAGKDVVTRDGHSYLKIQANQLYEIIADQDYGQHTLEILIPQGGLQAYTFTFG